MSRTDRIYASYLQFLVLLDLLQEFDCAKNMVVGICLKNHLLQVLYLHIRFNVFFTDMLCFCFFGVWELANQPDTIGKGCRTLQRSHVSFV